MASLYDRISKGALSVDEITASMKRSTSVGGKYFQSMEKQSKTLNGQISTLKDNFSMFAGVLAEDTTNAISSEFLPALNETIQAMQEGFSEEGFEGMAEAFAEGFTNILMMLVEKAPEVVDVAVSMVQTFVDAIEEKLPMITSSAIEIISSLLQGMIQMLPQILEMGIQIIIQLMQGIAQQAPQLVPQIIDCIMLMIETIIDNLDLLVDAGIDMMIALADGLIDALPELIDKAPVIIEKLLMAIAKNYPKLVKMGIELIIKLASGLIQAIPQLVSKIPEILNAIAESFKTLYKEMVEIGKSLLEGLWEGIKSTKDWLWNKVKGWAGSFVDGIKGVFGIHSPSRVFRDEIGKQLSAGLGVGFEEELSNVYDKMQRAIDLETEKMSASVQTGNVYNKIMNTVPVEVNGTYTSRLEVNGETLATVVNDVNDKKDLQYMF